MSAHVADEIARRAARIAAKGRECDFTAFDEVPLPTYATDAGGVLTYFNPACVGFAGRTPLLNQDRWCVTWRLYTLDGAFLPHEECPMAVALRRRQPVRGTIAFAERPDGVRSGFMPFPTPLFGGDGELLGAVNVFLETATGEPVNFLADEARRCRRLAGYVDEQTAATLLALAAEYEETARQLNAR